MPSNWNDSIATSIRIAAPPSVVFAILTDHAAYPSWNPFIVSMTPSAPATSIGPGVKLTNKLNTNTLKLSSPDPSYMTFYPTIQTYKQDEQLAWLGKLMTGGLFDGVHSFTVKPTADGGSDFVHGEEFSGLLVWMGKATGAKWYSNMYNQTKAGFEAMNVALKQRAEAQLAQAK